MGFELGLYLLLGPLAKRQRFLVRYLTTNGNLTSCSDKSPFAVNRSPFAMRYRRVKKTSARRSLVLLFLGCLQLAQGLFLPGTAQAAAGGGVSAQALVEKDAVSVGEPFLLQIRVEGSDLAPGTDPPDLSGVVDFAVEVLGGRSNNSSSITIINGKMSKVESFGCIYSYRLTPKKAGRIEIPSIAVALDAVKSKILHTNPLTITVVEPEATTEFHLELKFSKTNFYVGEPVILTVIWYLGKDVESVTFNVPIFQDEAFAFIDSKMDQDPRKQYFQIQVGGANVLAEKGTADYGGRQYTTLSFRKIFFARRPGNFETPEATVSCKALVGSAGRQQRRSPLDGFFDDDFFNPGKKALYKTFVARSQPVILTALALPEEGKPANFAGWVGHFQVETAASPAEVSVGDPITLTVSVKGPDYLDHVELPPLAKDPEIERDFKVPEEMAAGVVRGSVKQFTQTLRPKSAEVKAVPPLKIPYFNPDSGRYEIAESKPIALMVKAVRVLTSADAEGKPGETAFRKSELESWSQGIAFNYEGPGVLERQGYRISVVVRSPLWVAVMSIPFLAFVGLLIMTMTRQRQTADPNRLMFRKAFARFERRVGAIGAKGSPDGGACAVLLDAIRIYLCDKLRHNGSALTFAEIEGKLKERGIDAELTERLRGLFAACEQSSYGGMSLEKPFEEVTREALEVIRSLDRAASAK
jgi:hypothetical protein